LVVAAIAAVAVSFFLFFLTSFRFILQIKNHNDEKREREGGRERGGGGRREKLQGKYLKNSPRKSSKKFQREILARKCSKHTFIRLASYVLDCLMIFAYFFGLISYVSFKIHFTA